MQNINNNMSDLSDTSSVSSKQTKKSDEDETFQTFCKQMLKTRIFKGNYQERRLVATLNNNYRDVIIINKRENELIKDLTYLRNRINSYYENKKKLWIGITLPTMIGAPAAGVCIWTEVSGIPFGQHWFYIRSVKFRDNEVIIKVTSLRYAEDEDDNCVFYNGRNLSRSNIKNECDDSNDENKDDNNVPTLSDFIETFTSMKNSAASTLLSFLRQDVNKDNIIRIIRFICILIISLLTFSVEALKYIGLYSIRFMSELRLWVQTLTPIILKLIELFGKLIGGLYLLIAMLWRDVFNPNNNRNDGTLAVAQHMYYPQNNENHRPLPITYGRDFYQSLHNRRSPNSRNRGRDFR